MLTYMQVHLLLVIPPILVLGLLYAPLFGRRDALKVGWLMLMATLYTTPWDNYIISQSAWSYPPSSILFKIAHVPFEEHLFFVLQPLLLILLHCIATLGDMVPFDVTGLPVKERRVVTSSRKAEKTSPSVYCTVQTLPRRPRAALGWVGLTALGFLLLSPVDIRPALTVLPARWAAPLASREHRFYLGMILAWVCPVIGGLTWLGAGAGRKGDRLAMGFGVGWLWMVDTIAINSGSWTISEPTSLGIFLWKGLPIEEAIFFVLTSHLIILSAALISHLHVLMLLAPSASGTCPPSSPLAHITHLARLALDPPPVDVRLLTALTSAEETLRKGSRSFSVAKMVWGREMRIGLVAVYGWCRVTDDLIDDYKGDKILNNGYASSHPVDDKAKDARLDLLQMMTDFLTMSYGAAALEPAQRAAAFDAFTREYHLPAAAEPSFYLFHMMIPALSPRDGFDDLIAGYKMDLAFPTPPPCNPLERFAMRADAARPLVSPIATQEDLLLYADRVAGSVADVVCHLAWRILEDETPRRTDGRRRETIKSARKMGRALQLVNIARDVHTDAVMNRVYVPLEVFDEAQEDLRGLLSAPRHAPISGSYAPYTLPLLDMAEGMRSDSIGAIANLPRTARAGTRAMVASYFEIGYEVQRRRGELPEDRLRVSARRRIMAVVRTIWGL